MTIQAKNERTLYNHKCWYEKRSRTKSATLSLHRKEKTPMAKESYYMD